VAYVPTPVAGNGLAFFFGDLGLVKCVDAASGSNRWQTTPLKRRR
jgi:hypothetical protein